MNLPEIRIFYAALLDTESRVISEKWGRQLDSWENCTHRALLYRDEWKKYEKEIIEMITSLLGLEFYKPVIDVHLGQFFKPKSEPIIISFMDEPDQFVDTLAHELVHVLLTDNEICQLSGKHLGLRLADRWERIFKGENSFTTIVHIPVHAVMQKVFTDVFKDESRKKRDIETLKRFKSDDHLASWSYVDRVGSKKIIDMLKEDFRMLEIELAERQ